MLNSIQLLPDPKNNNIVGSGPGSLLPRSSARSTRRESHGAHSLPRSRALFPAVRDDPARTHERCVRVDCGIYGKGGRRAHPARGNPRARGQPEQNLTGALYEPPGAAVCARAQGRNGHAERYKETVATPSAVRAFLVALIVTPLLTFAPFILFPQSAS